jgi:hypothetical protein
VKLAVELFSLIKKHEQNKKMKEEEDGVVWEEE